MSLPLVNAIIAIFVLFIPYLVTIGLVMFFPILMYLLPDIEVEPPPPRTWRHLSQERE
jgi:hypothetical protein